MKPILPLLTSAILSISINLAAQSYVPLKEDTRMTIQPRIEIEAYSVPLKDVRLLDGPFKHAMELDKKWLMSLEPDRFLHRFHQNAGFIPKAPIYEGWENSTQSGFCFGHYLSAMSMLYAATGDQKVKERIDYCINELENCQKAIGTGYVGGIPNGEKIWNDLASGNINEINGGWINGYWVPWYAIHKLWAGLTDVYLYTGDEKAKSIVIKLTDWACKKFEHLSEEQWQYILQCEFGGMNDALYNVYAITGNKEHLRLADNFYHKAVLDPLSQKKDQLAGLHANTQIPKIIGTARAYELTASEKDKTIATFFWNTVVHNHSYCIGGNSNFEHFGKPRQLSGQLSDKTTETCNTYNMLKLTRHLFSWDPKAEYMDFYERALYNHILSSQNPETGMVSYYVPLADNSRKGFSSPDHSFWCCVGTGFENHVKYGEEIFSFGKDALYVNLFIASELNWEQKGMKIRQETNFPDSDNSTLIILSSRPQATTLHIRYPSWAGSGFAIKINGNAQTVRQKPGSYVAIERTWKNGDKIEITLPKQLRKELLLGDDHKTALLYGPIVLTGEMEAGQRTPVFMNNGSDISDWIKQDQNNFNTFVTKGGLPNDVRLIPFYKKYEGYYSIYFDCFTPDEWKNVQTKYEEELEYQRELLRLTVDYFRPSEQQQEIDHHFKGTNVSRGEGASGRKWCDTENGYFSFEMAVNPELPMNLALTYWGSDKGNRNFDILINDEKIAIEELTGKRPNEFIDITYAIPFHLTKGKEKVIVKLQSHPGNKAGGIFGARTLLKAVLPEKI